MMASKATHVMAITDAGGNLATKHLTCGEITEAYNNLARRSARALELSNEDVDALVSMLRAEQFGDFGKPDPVLGSILMRLLALGSE